MSRAFIKEDAGDPDELPERAQSAAPNYVTPAGLEALRAAADGLKAKAAGVPRDSKEGRALLRDLRYYQGRVASAILVDAAGRPGDEVRFGASVDLKAASGTVMTFSLVGQDEADEKAGKLSWDSSLALSLMGAKVGGAVEWAPPEGPGRLVVAAIRYPPRVPPAIS